MVITYSQSQLMSIGESVLAMPPQEWLAHQQQITELLLDNQQTYHHQTTKAVHINNNNNPPIIDSASDEQQKFLSRFLLMNQLENLNLNNTQNQSQHSQKRSQSRSMTADSLLRDFVQLQEKLGMARAHDPFSSFMDSDTNDIRSQFQQTSARDDPKLTESVANFFRKAQQIFRPATTVDTDDLANTAFDQPSRARRLSDVEAELIGDRKPTSSS